MTIKLYIEYGLNVLPYKYCHINFCEAHNIFINRKYRLLPKIVKQQDDQFEDQTFFNNCLREKKRSGHTFANIKINVHSTREKDDKVVLDKRIKRFNFVAHK